MIEKPEAVNSVRFGCVWPDEFETRRRLKENVKASVMGKDTKGRLLYTGHLMFRLQYETDADAFVDRFGGKKFWYHDYGPMQWLVHSKTTKIDITVSQADIYFARWEAEGDMVRSEAKTKASFDRIWKYEVEQTREAMTNRTPLRKHMWSPRAAWNYTVDGFSDAGLFASYSSGAKTCQSLFKVRNAGRKSDKPIKYQMLIRKPGKSGHHIAFDKPKKP